jgi:hypothetical protein
MRVQVDEGRGSQSCVALLSWLSYPSTGLAMVWEEKMRLGALSVFVVLGVAACGGSGSNPEAAEAKARNQALREAAAANARQVQVSGRTFQVIRIEGGWDHLVQQADGTPGLSYIDRPYALVELTSPTGASFTGRDIERAARQATGCQAEFNAGVLSFLGGFDPATSDLQALGQQSRTPIETWRADLSC